MTLVAANDALYALRPDSLETFVGQEGLKGRLRPWIAESRETNSPLAHLLLTSEPGTGKTTLAEIIAHELGDPFTAIDISQMTERQFTSFIRRFEGGVLLLDEIHRARPHQQDQLLTLMEEGYISTPYGGRVCVGWITVIAATTEPHKIMPAVTSRFPVRLEFDPYTDAEMGKIIANMATMLDLSLPEAVSTELGLAAGGIPRAARELVRSWRALTFTGKPTVVAALKLAGREPDGLTSQHLAYLRCLDRLEGQAGEGVLTNVLRVHVSHLHSLERLLIDRELITLTPAGRALTGAGDRRLRGEVHMHMRRREVSE